MNEENNREARLETELQNALVIIVGEYPRDDERHTWACRVAKEFDLDLGEMG